MILSFASVSRAFRWDGAESGSMESYSSSIAAVSAWWLSMKIFSLFEMCGVARWWEGCQKVFLKCSCFAGFLSGGARVKVG